MAVQCIECFHLAVVLANLLQLLLPRPPAASSAVEWAPVTHLSVSHRLLWSFQLQNVSHLFIIFINPHYYFPSPFPNSKNTIVYNELVDLIIPLLIICNKFHAILKGFTIHFLHQLLITDHSLYLFIIGQKGRGQKEGERHQCAWETSIRCFLHTPNQEPGPKARHVPSLGMDLLACGTMPDPLSHTSQGQNTIF